MQIQPVGTFPVQFVAHDWTRQPLLVGSMYTQLMCPSRKRVKGNQCFSVFTFQHLVASYGRFAMLKAYYLTRPVVQIRAKRQTDNPFVGTDRSGQDGGIAFFICLPLKSACST